ncbi:LysM peptidoglycan-binding domain-containing protein [Flavobacterium azooxidireducens]|uniref:LysM peptidoglycan-binding domain-containing protein n=1 Tax=Flavobacterium azooxidireducens TaxID=1871076 RepID=A0ABY4KCJ6_9FLAO|nr:LysM peptidoglycan-binding domain-containing protein [Flavobacterium azooxidireducens]UPQ78507.1 LysM peptidoglycan-binding domain-containing protein [Flavobacterium azooxidireducens]
MNKHTLLFLIVFQLSVFFGFAQENTSKHTVIKGETVSSIARKYKVTPNDLYQLNPDIFDGIKEDQVIIIPNSVIKSTSNTVKTESSSNKSSDGVIYHKVEFGETKFGLSRRYGVSISELERQNPHIVNMLQAGHQLEIRGGVDSNPTKSISIVSNSTTSEFKTYEVLPGETLYGISRRYGLTVDDLVDANSLVGILRSGQILRIPVKNTVKENENNQFHLVQEGETKYGLSKRYGVTIGELEQKNPQIVRMLQTGQRIVIPGRISSNLVQKQETKQEVKVVETPKSEPEIVETPTKIEKVEEVVVISEPQKEEKPEVKVVEKESVNSESTNNNWIDYEIQPKETLFGLSRMAGVSQDKLIEVNPILNEGVKAGTIIKMPSDKVSEYKKPETTISETKTNSVIENKVEAVGLLKTINKIEKKEITFLTSFSSEKYLSFIQNPIAEPTKEIEFFAGANLAIDSLKNMGVMVELKNIQIEVSKDGKADVSSLKKNNVDKSKAVFYYSEGINSEKIAEFSAKNTIPFLVNSFEVSAQKSATTYVSIPSKNDLALMVLKYISDKNGNLVVVSDAVSALNDDFILQNFPKARFVKISEKDVLEDEALTKELILNRKNFVLLNTDKTGLILNTTTVLLKHSKEYNIQLALLEPKESIQKEGFSEMRFKALNTIYPSYSDRNNFNEVEKFKADFKRKYSFEASDEVIKGFDVTFDALVRLFQDKNFEAMAKDEISEQLNHKFHYFKDSNGGYSNKGGYILQFDKDSNTKIAN